MDVSVCFFYVQELSDAFKEAAEEGNRTRIDEVIDQLFVALKEQRKILAIDCVTYQPSATVWMTLCGRIKQVAPDHATQFLNLLNNIANCALQYEKYKKIFLSSEPKSQNKAAKLIEKAIRQGAAGALEAYLHLGADLNRMHANGCTPLIYAMMSKNPRIVSVLLDLGVDPNLAGADGRLPYQIAAQAMDLATCQILVEKGVILPTVIDHAIAQQDFITLDFLFYSHYQSNGTKEFVRAITEGKLELAEYLLSAGLVSVNDACLNTLTPLQLAITTNALDLVPILLKYKADPNFVGVHKSALDAAVLNNNSDLVAFLLAHGADVNQAPVGGISPLVHALGLNRMERADQLIAAGADRKFAITVCYLKFVGHAWGLAQNIKVVDSFNREISVELEGFEREFFLVSMRKMASKFFVHHPFGQELVHALAYAYPLRSTKVIRRLISNRKPAIIMGGYSGHTVGFAILRKKIFLCNRGAGCNPGDHQVSIYAFPKKIGLITVVNALTMEYLNQQDFEDGLGSLRLHKIGGYHQKDIKVGICSWSSCKSVVEVFCRVFEGHNRTYKAFTQKVREAVVIDYINRCPTLDEDLLQAIRDKAVEKGNQARSIAAIDCVHPGVEFINRQRRRMKIVAVAASVTPDLIEIE